jgi:hypothetical protein
VITPPCYSTEQSLTEAVISTFNTAGNSAHISFKNASITSILFLFESVLWDISEKNRLSACKAKRQFQVTANVFCWRFNEMNLVF